VLAIASLSLVQLASARPNGQAATKTVQVKGGEFFFRLSTKSLARPGKVVFVFKNVGHVEHDFKINRKRTPLLQPGKTARLVVTFKKKGKYTLPVHRSRTRSSRHEGRLHRSLARRSSCLR
jgi:uncharacterized cupredoxin-like copper-binding protein